MANRLFKKVNGKWEAVRFKKKVNGAWVDCPVYKKENGVWNRIDQQLVNKTITLEGTGNWNGSYRNTTGTGIFNIRTNNTSLYQGLYGSDRHLNALCFTELFKQARDKGTIVKAELIIKNSHTYAGAGLNSIVVGMSNLSTSKPNSIEFSQRGSDHFCASQKFVKEEIKTIQLNATCISQIQSAKINGLSIISANGFTQDNYGYFDGDGNNRPVMKITVQYQVWE